MIIFLTGLPGVGKSTVGRIVAEKLKYSFVELDQLIEKKTGKSIPELFSVDEKFFRFWESKVLKEVVDGLSNSVVSLGGGAIILKENLDLIRQKGIVVNLTAQVQQILKRIESDTSRPILYGDKRSRLETIASDREKLYRICDFSVDTSDISPEIAAERILHFLSEFSNIRSIRVNLYDRSYDILIGSNLPKSIIQNRVKRNLPDLKKVVIITSPSIKYVSLNGVSLYGRVKAIFETSEVVEVDLPEGEQTKDILYAIHLWNKFTEKEIRKSDLIVVVGGGVLGDLVGFVASTYLRGVKYINVPTTLLSQVDSSIGGKTGVNTEIAKNMVGTIYQPFLVLSDIDFIKTLPKSEFFSGMGEVLKYAVSSDRYLFDFVSERIDDIMNRDQDVIKNMVSLCAKIKGDIVSADEYEEKGLRFVLNFGHTIGHAIESANNFKIPHGIAVAKGSIFETKISDKILGKNLYPQVLDFARALGFDEQFEIKDVKRFISALKVDKKTRAEYINFILIEDIGKGRLERIKISEFVSILKEVLKIDL
ncbi:MAG: 3-dehydroquinate synthase [Candidatus Calescibacterium sp.]|nr:3-dehydroquinate synthase [Candidatus Calescibacterium sp.]MCX7734015.1 3-dehydroquinate synthase [bacterium]MDW8086386.1 3-dehydroquinate synthase [Candidatus Calescibacterium sp.]